MAQTAVKTEMSLASWARAIQRSAIQEMLAIGSRPGILSFALGLPAHELFPRETFSILIPDILANEPFALQYGPPIKSLKTHIVALMAQRGVVCREEQVFLTAGAQQAMSLLARLLLDTHGSVLLEETIYSGFQQAIEPFQPKRLTVPTDVETGIDVAAVEAQLQRHGAPAFIYAISEGHNPLAVSISMQKRRRLVELARQYHVPIIEDDTYGLLYYDNISLPPMRALDSDWVIYLGSFSKILAPALRVGWMIVPEELTARLSILKEASDLDVATFGQRIIAAYLDTGQLPEHLARLRTEYTARRDAMLSALHSQFPTEARWNKPSNGMFIWVELPTGVDTGEILNRAIEQEHIAFLPGHAFGVAGSRKAAHCMRLNFSNSSCENIVEGIARLARVL